MTHKKIYIAFDLGWSGGRGIAAQFDGTRIHQQEIGRFPCERVWLNGHLYWNILSIWQSILNILRAAAQQVEGEIVSVAIDCWSNDFGLLDANGNLLGIPHCYRDPFTAGMMDRVLDKLPREELFQRTGIQFMPTNTLYQLVAMRHGNFPQLDVARHCLLLPDLLNYWLTGNTVAEYTVASVSQAVNIQARRWDTDLLERLDLPAAIFPPIVESGDVVGVLRERLQSELGMGSVTVRTTAAHDTASAVAAVPATSKRFAYISSGTWGLLGTENDYPLLTPQVQTFNFGNEGGAFGTYRLLRNIPNMWLVQECARRWERDGVRQSWDELLQLAQQAPAFQPFVDPDHADFTGPDDMPAAIQAYCERTHQPIPHSKGEILRCCYESLAMKYRYTLERLALLVGEKAAVFHIVGGASQNKMLDQFAANATGLCVEAGPVEATVMGNLIVQLIGSGELSNLAEGRHLIRASSHLEVFEPQETAQWSAQYERFLEITG